MSEQNLTDDYRSDIDRLEGSALYGELRRRAALPHAYADSSALDLAHDACHYATQRTKLVMVHMRQYTLHDADHLFRVLTLMERLLPAGTIALLSTPEILLLILSAMFHDIGMAASDAEVQEWTSTWDVSARARGLSPEGQRFELFTKGRLERVREVDTLTLRGDYSQAALIREHLVAEYIRHTHADRAISIIEADWATRLRYQDTDLAGILAAICFSHNSDALRLLEEEDSLLCGSSGQYVCIPFVGVVLRLADILDFDAKRTPSVLFAHLGVRHPVSLTEWRKHRSVSAWSISGDHISFAAECEHPGIELSIRKFCQTIDHELVACGAVLRNLRFINRPQASRPSHYCIPLPARVDTSRVGPKRDIRRRPMYRYLDCQFTLDRRQVIDLLMGTHLYGDPSLAVRELVQNALDACILRRAREGFWGNSFVPAIEVVIEKVGQDEILRVSDNGVGMDEDIVQRYLSKIGTSYYRSTEFLELKARESLDITPISRFGIGILACFMVADSFNFHTRRLKGNHSSSDPIEVRVEGLDSVFWFKPGSKEAPGTEVTLHLRPGHPWHWRDDRQRAELIAALFPRPAVPIKIRCGSQHLIHDGSTFGSRVTQGAAPTARPIREVAVSLNGDGLFGHARVFILANSGLPVRAVESRVDAVRVGDDDREYVLRRKFVAQPNDISEVASHLEPTDSGFEVSDGYSRVVPSKSELSIQGVQVPMNLIPDYYWRERQPAHLLLPFPMHIVIDLEGSVGLTLNAARTQVIADEHWVKFVTVLSEHLCRGVRAAVGGEFWNALLPVWSETLPDERKSVSVTAFYEGLRRIGGNSVG